MRKRMTAAGIGVALALAAPAAGRAADLRSLVRAELAFSRLSEAQGIRASFLAFFAEDSIVFRPRPVPGRKFYLRSGFRSRLPQLGTCFRRYLRVGRPRLYDRAVRVPEGKGVRPGRAAGPFRLGLARPKGRGLESRFRRRASIIPILSRPSPSWIRTACSPAPAPKLPLRRTPKRPGPKFSIWSGPSRRARPGTGSGRWSRRCRPRFGSTSRARSPAGGKKPPLAALSKKPAAFRWTPGSSVRLELGRSGIFRRDFRIRAPEPVVPSWRPTSELHIWKKNGSGRWEIVLYVAGLVPPPPPGK